MFECEYSREPVDFRLLWLRFLKKIWILPVAALAGLLIVGSAYYMSRLCFGNARTYQTDTMYHVTFAEDSTGKKYDYINYYTWGELVKTDYFIDSIYEELSGSVTKEEIKEAVYANVESDGRFLYTHCTSRSPELSERLERALEKAILAYPDRMVELESISIERRDEKSWDSSNIRLGTACILGAVTGLFVALFAVVIYLINDTSVYVPATLEKRYHIPSLTCPSMEEYEANCRLMLKDFTSLNVVAIDSCKDLEGLNLYKDSTFFENPVVATENIEKLSEKDCVVAVRAGAHNGKCLERTLEELGRMNTKIAAFVLVGEDTRLIKAYYRK